MGHRCSTRSRSSTKKTRHVHTNDAAQLPQDGQPLCLLQELFTGQQLPEDDVRTVQLRRWGGGRAIQDPLTDSLPRTLSPACPTPVWLGLIHVGSRVSGMTCPRGWGGLPWGRVMPNSGSTASSAWVSSPRRSWGSAVRSSAGWARLGASTWAGRA